MPVLYKYSDHAGYYIKTSISGVVTTFQVTHAGFQIIQTAGIKPGDTFSRDLLIGLWLEGEAYTGQSGPHYREEANINQEQFDFAEEIQGESPFPKCDCCSSLEKLSLVVVSAPGTIVKGEIACEPCFMAYSIESDQQTRLYIRRENNIQIAMLLASIQKKSLNAEKLDRLLRKT